MDSLLGPNASPVATALLLTLIEAVGDVSLKMKAPIIGFGAYNILAYVLFTRLPKAQLGLVNGYWDAFSNIITALLGMILFGERYNLCQLSGFAMISIGILLLAYGDGSLCGTNTTSKSTNK